jgi:uncharacterized membrane protein HdeD (DUF308 family)
MFELFVRNWWVVVVRGLLALSFGLAAILWPGATLMTLVLLFGGFAIADGALALVGLFNRDSPAHRWEMALHGIVSIGCGVLTIVWPGITTLALLYLIAARAILTGGLAIAAAIELRKAIANEWLLALTGILALLFGAGVAIWPGAGALALLGVIATYAILTGLLLIGLGIRLRRMRQIYPQTQAV